MSATFQGIETAKRGLNATQVSLNIVGNNIANVSTKGYTRQRVDTVSMAASGSQSRYAPEQAAMAGQGVAVAGVAQVRDSFLDKRFRDAQADVGYNDKMYEILSDVDTALDEYSSDGLKDALASFYDTLNDLSENADETVNASSVLTSAKGIVEVLNRFSASLDQVKGQQTFCLETDVNEVNSILQHISELNKSINREVYASSIEGSSGQYLSNELVDERNLMIDNLSYYGNISVYSNDDGSVRVDMNGQEIVNGTDSNSLNLIKNADGTVSLSWLSSSGDIKLGSGSLKAYLDTINGRGNGANGNENYQEGVPYYRDMINDFAQKFTSELNRVFPVVSASGTFKTLFTSGSNEPVTAANIQISDEWISDADYIIDSSVDKDGEFDNTYVLKAISLFAKDVRFGAMTGTFEEHINYYNSSKLGQQIVEYKSAKKTAQAVADDLQDSRDNVSGVSINEEGASMMSYQKAYNAMARVMTAMDDILDKLINGTGRVGL